MSFIQIIECRTDNIEEMQAIDRDWEQATEGKRTVRRSIVTRDRNDPNRYVIVTFFDSYESAMENSKLPETQACAERYAAAVESIAFQDLDVIDDRT
jgi:hypothetical protein